jgi:hypothetical protein
MEQRAARQPIKHLQETASRAGNARAGYARVRALLELSLLSTMHFAMRGCQIVSWLLCKVTYIGTQGSEIQSPSSTYLMSFPAAKQIAARAWPVKFKWLQADATQWQDSGSSWPVT